MNFFQLIVKLETDKFYHLGRIIILVGEFCEKGYNKEVEGLTKLAKLDFLLRYPVYLERALQRVNKIKYYVKVQEHERKSVESKMVRFKYGPWDYRYREYINVLVGMNLVYVRTEGRTIRIGLTQHGLEKRKLLGEQEAFRNIAERAKLLRKSFDWNGTRLKDFIYSTFPEIISLQYGEHIQ